MAAPRRPSGRETWVGSICTGAFILAASGLLDGCEVTTYWSQIPNLNLLAEKLKFEVGEGYPASSWTPRGSGSPAGAPAVPLNLGGRPDLGVRPSGGVAIQEVFHAQPWLHAD